MNAFASVVCVVAFSAPASGLTAAVLGFAGPAQADPPSPGPHYHVDNHDEVNTTNGFVDAPF